MNFVFVSLQRINTDRESTSTSLAKELSKTHRVLYVNPPIDRRTWMSGGHDPYIEAHKKMIKAGKAGLEKFSDNLSVLYPKRIIESVNWIPFTKIFSVFNKVNNLRFSADIKHALHELNFSDFILINDKDIFRSYYLKELLHPRLSIYLDRDYTLGFKYWQRHGFELEPKLMQKSDGIVCNSLDFTRRAAKYNSNSFYIGNGADLSVFDYRKDWQMPIELKSMKRPIIGYVGALNSQRIDIGLIDSLAVKRPDWQFVFIGEEDDTFRTSRLHGRNNIMFIRKKHTSVVPGYVREFDVCINPQLVNEITIGNFPLKIVEYLAMGRPVVATATNTMKEVFSDWTYLVNSADEYIMAIEKAIIEDNTNLQRKRICAAHQFGWPSVAAKLLESIDQIEKRKPDLHEK